MRVTQTTSAEETEFAAMKSEQTARLVLRDTSLYTQIVISATLLGLLQFNSMKVWLPIAFSGASFVIFCIYATNDIYVTQISKFVSERFRTLSSWEDWHRAGLLYRFQKAFRQFAVFGAFVGAPVVITAISIAYGSALWTSNLVLAGIVTHLLQVTLYLILIRH